MKIVTFKYNNKLDLGLLLNNNIYSLSDEKHYVSNNMNDFLQMGEEGIKKAKILEENIKQELTDVSAIKLDSAELFAPVPNPTSCRDAYAFRQHVATARRNRGVDMIPEFDQFPIFYFTNHNAILGPSQDIICMPDHMLRLDFELEAAVVIGK